jgi:endonuclease/exonuclease/phosphatase family metal-dependent hydrolase
MQNLRWLVLLWLLTSNGFADQFRIVTWNLDWFPGKGPASNPAQRALHMSEARDALLDLKPDFLCLQEVRDYESVEQLVKVLPGFQVHVVSRFKDKFADILGIQQTAICGFKPAEAAWSESWRRGQSEPPRGFSFSAIRTGEGNYLLVYSVHFKSNLGSLPDDFAKREEAARQLLEHESAMEKVYSKIGKVSVVLAGDFNTTPDDPRFAPDQTFPLLTKSFSWCWAKTPPPKRVTIPSHGRYPAATFDGFFVKDCTIISVDVVNAGQDPVCECRVRFLRRANA